MLRVARDGAGGQYGGSRKGAGRGYGASHRRRWRIFRARDIEFHTVPYPPLQRLDDDYRDRLIDGKVEDFCVTCGINCFTLFDSFHGETPRELHVTTIDHHPNQYANGIASKAVAEYMGRTSKLF